MSTFFRNIPTLNEILDAPPLKQLIETANRQTVVVSAKKFLAGLEAEVRSTAATVPIPNVRDLAKQIAQWISEGQPPRPQSMINATGDVLGGDFTFIDFIDPNAPVGFEVDTLIDLKNVDPSATDVYWSL